MPDWVTGLINHENAAIAQGWAGVAQAFFAFILLLAIGLQLGIMMRQAEHARTSNQIAIAFNKATIIIREWSWGPDKERPEGAEIWSVRPVIENVGNIAAINGISYVNGAFFETGTEPDEAHFTNVYTEGWFSQFSIGPKSHMFGLGWMIFMEDILKSRQGQGKYYIWGFMEYDDGFSPPRRVLRFCSSFHSRGPDPKFRDTIGPVNEEHHKHNCSDEGCSAGYGPPVSLENRLKRIHLWAI